LRHLPLILFWFCLIVYGLLIHPLLFNGDRFSVEVIVLISILFNCFYLLWDGHKWQTIHQHITDKVAETIPIILILISIGALIGSWVICGTIPMLTYYGLDLIQPNVLYLAAFLICSVFSILTGTSWGTLGTIGVVMISIATVFELNLGICAGAIISGSLFGDKLSPLSDTTNITALAAEVDLMDHVKSMAYSVVPSAIICAIIFALLSPDIGTNQDMTSVNEVRSDLSTMFNFSWILLLPVVVVVYGSLKRYPIFLVLTTGAVLGILLAFIFQDFKAIDVFGAVKSGFDPKMIPSDFEAKSNITRILKSGGITSLVTPILVAVLFFALLGTLNVVNAIEKTVKPITSLIKGKSSTVIASIIGTTFFHGLVTSMYATIFLSSETFKNKYKEFNISKSVLSRSIEDGGTLISPLIPWTPTSLFMTATLGVSLGDFLPYHLLAYVNYLIAIVFALTGIAVFKRKI